MLKQLVSELDSIVMAISSSIMDTKNGQMKCARWHVVVGFMTAVVII